jgi:hypothetical protein
LCESISLLFVAGHRWLIPFFTSDAGAAAYALIRMQRVVAFNGMTAGYEVGSGLLRAMGHSLQPALLVAVVVFDSFSECDACMHIASDGTTAWMNKALLLHAFAYPFTKLGLLRVTGLVPADNQAALAFDENLGFVREGYHPKAGPGGKDLVSLGLLKENCRFVGRHT